LKYTKESSLQMAKKQRSAGIIQNSKMAVKQQIYMYNVFQKLAPFYFNNN